MSIDPVFPIEAPAFLWVHPLTYRNLDGDSVTTDEEGRWHYDAPTAVAFTGYLTAPNPREVDRAAARGVILDAVCLAPHGTAVTDESTVTADSGSGVPSWLLGTYRVTVVRPNPSHLRLMLTRIRDELPAHDPGLVVDVNVTPDTVEGSA